MAEAPRRFRAADALRLAKMGDFAGARSALKQAVGLPGKLTAADALKHLKDTGNQEQAKQILQGAVGMRKLPTSPADIPGGVERMGPQPGATIPNSGIQPPKMTGAPTMGPAPSATMGPAAPMKPPGLPKLETDPMGGSTGPGMKRGGKVSGASKRADGIAQRGKTRGRYL